MDNNHWWLIAFGMAGGLLRNMREKITSGPVNWREPAFWRDVVLELGTSAFSTWAVYSLCVGVGFNNEVAVAFGGMAGYMGGSSIDVVCKVVAGRKQ